MVGVFAAVVAICSRLLWPRVPSRLLQRRAAWGCCGRMFAAAVAACFFAVAAAVRCFAVDEGHPFAAAIR